MAEGDDEDFYATNARRYVALFDTYEARLDGERQHGETPVAVPVADAAPIEVTVEDPPMSPVVPAPRVEVMAEEPPMAPPPVVELSEAEEESVEIVGDLPMLPDAVVSDTTPILVWLDGRYLTPEALRETATVLLGDQGALQAEGFVTMFEGYFNEFAQAGGTSIAFAWNPEVENEQQSQALHVSMTEGAEEDRLAAWIRKPNPAPEQELRIKRAGARSF